MYIHSNQEIHLQWHSDKVIITKHWIIVLPRQKTVNQDYEHQSKYKLGTDHVVSCQK